MICLRGESCVIGTSSGCSYGPFHPDFLINGKFDLSKVELTKLEVTLNAVNGGVRTGMLSFYANAVSDVPEPASVALFGLGVLGMAAFGRRIAG